MNESIFIYSTILRSPGSEFTQEEAIARQIAIRDQFTAVVPAIKHLRFSILKEQLVIKNNQLVLKYYLVESPQLLLDLHPKDLRSKVKASGLMRLHEDYNMLKHSAKSNQSRMNEIVRESMTPLFEFGYEADLNAGKMSADDAAFRKVVHSEKGKTIHMTFADETIPFQIPLLPSFLPEPGTRNIHATIRNISAKSAVLATIREIDSGEVSKSAPLPLNRIVLHRIKERSWLWPLLYAAVEHNIVVEAEVKVALCADTLKAGYLELYQIINADRLRASFNDMHLIRKDD